MPTFPKLPLPVLPAEVFVAPTHVRDLDIRPETLPADIGAAARQLWERGEQRAALALLYRGMLSRLVRAWTRFGYGRQDVESSAVYSLCDEFAAALRPVPAVDAALQRGTA